MIKKFTYGEPVFVDPVSGSLPRYFRPRDPGAYTITVEARDSANNRSSRSITVRAVLAGQTLSGVDGPPTVDEVIPADGAREIMVTMPVMVTFNEPVEPASVNADTLKLLDHGPADSPTILFGTPVPASIYLSTEGGRMKATLQPVSNLMFGHRYEVVVNDVPEDQRIMDAIDNPSVCPEGTTPPPQGCRLPMTQVYRAVFETKVPQVYDLVYGSSQQPIVGGYSGDIALYTDVASGRTYAYATSGYYGWFVADVTDPTQPFPTFSLGASPFNYRNVAVEPQRKILAMTDSITQSSITGYVRFYDLSTEPGTPTWIGQTKLAEGSSGVPTKVALSGNYAYVSTVMIGLQVVDIDSATTPVDAVGSGTSWQSGDDVLQQQDSKLSIVGTFDTIGLGFKQPRDIALYQPGRALLSTTSGFRLGHGCGRRIRLYGPGRDFPCHGHSRNLRHADHKWTNAGRDQYRGRDRSGQSPEDRHSNRQPGERGQLPRHGRHDQQNRRSCVYRRRHGRLRCGHKRSIPSDAFEHDKRHACKPRQYFDDGTWLFRRPYRERRVGVPGEPGQGDEGAGFGLLQNNRAEHKSC